MIPIKLGWIEMREGREMEGADRVVVEGEREEKRGRLVQMKTSFSPSLASAEGEEKAGWPCFHRRKAAAPDVKVVPAWGRPPSLEMNCDGSRWSQSIHSESRRFSSTPVNVTSSTGAGWRFVRSPRPQQREDSVASRDAEERRGFNGTGWFNMSFRKTLGCFNFNYHVSYRSICGYIDWTPFTAVSPGSEKLVFSQLSRLFILLLGCARMKTRAVTYLQRILLSSSLS